MLKVQRVMQKKAMCGPACLAMVMGYWDKPVSLNRLIKASRASKARGLLPGGFRRAAAAFGFTIQIKDNARLEDIRKALNAGTPPIVNWFSVNEGHYSVVVALTPTRITLIDPEIDSLHHMPIAVFKRVWFGVDPEPARTTHDFHLRRLIILRPRAQQTTAQRARGAGRGSLQNRRRSPR